MRQALTIRVLRAGIRETGCPTVDHGRESGSMDFAYDRDEWDAALEAAELWEFCPTDSGEKFGPLAQWISDQVIDHEKVDRDPELITAAFDRLTENGETEFSPERLIDVLNTGRA